MISHKKFDLIAVLLISSVLVLTLCALFVPISFFAGEDAGDYIYSENHAVNISGDDLYETYSASSHYKISLNGSSAESSCRSVKVENGNVTVLGGGTYVISGTLSGSLIVDSSDGALVRLIFNGVNITSEDFSALYIKNAKKTVITLIDKTENSLTDSKTYSAEKTQKDKATAALYSKDDLCINGSGTLFINANYQDGIKANDTLKIIKSKIEINSADDAVNANDFIFMSNCSLRIKSGGDSIKCDNEKEGKGFIALENAQLNLQSEGDCISASSALYLNSSTVTACAGGGSANYEEKRKSFATDFFSEKNAEEKSTKAIKAKSNIIINNGSFILDSKDDSLHSDANIDIRGGSFLLSSGDDAVHADKALLLNPEKMEITACYEGLEGAYITVNGGTFSIISRDDAINAVGEKSANPPPSMHTLSNGEAKTSAEDIFLTINGGTFHIGTSGDGIDSNGSAAVNGGYIEIFGPEDGANGSLDIGDGAYVLLVNGGTLIAAGSSSMAEHPSALSLQGSLAFYLDETFSAGKNISLKDADGNEILQAVCTKSFDFVTVSAPLLKDGEEYTLFVDKNECARVTFEGTFSQYGTRKSSRAPEFERRKEK